MLGIVAIAISGVSLLLNIIGLAIPYWLYVSQNSITSKIGLWQSCLDSECSSISGATADSSLKATRALELLGMILLIGTIVCALLKLIVMKEQALLPKVAGALAAVAGAFMIIGCIIFAAKYKGDYAIFDPYDLHAGFALCIVAGVGSIVACVLFFLNKED